VDGTVQIWTLAIGQNLATLATKASASLDAIFSSDGSRVLTYGEDKAVIWDVRDGRKLLTLAHRDPISAASFSPDRRVVVTTADEGRFWGGEDGHFIASFHLDSRVSRILYSPDGQKILTRGYDNAPNLRSALDGHVLTKFQHDGPVNDAVFSPDSKLVVTAARDGVVRIWNVAGTLLKSLKETEPDVLPMESGVFAVSFSPDGQRIAAAGDWNIARVWDITSGQLLFRLDTAGRWVFRAFFSPDGTRILTDIKDDTYKNVQIWTSAGELISDKRFVPGNTPDKGLFAFSSDGRWFVTSGDKTIRIWTTRSGQLVASIVGVTAPDPSAKALFSPDGRHILTFGENNAVQVWRIVSLLDLDNILSG
jgi:WD40 repeat protein